MKIILAVLTIFVAAQTAHAQSVDTQSDSYVCYHGRADDPRTNAACDRVEAQASRPVAQVAPPPAPKGDASAAQNAESFAATPNPSTADETKAKAPAAQPAPTDVGEAPFNAQTGAEEANADEGDSDVHIHGSWLAGLGALAIIAIAIGCFIALAIHFIPTIIAIARRKRNAVWIFVVNLFLGWTVIGWVWALVWSLMTDPI